MFSEKYIHILCWNYNFQQYTINSENSHDEKVQFIFRKVTCFCLPTLISGRSAGPCMRNSINHYVSLTTALSNVTVKRQMTGSHVAPVSCWVCFVPWTFRSKCQVVANSTITDQPGHQRFNMCGDPYWLQAEVKDQLGPSQVDNWKRWFIQKSSSTSLFFLSHISYTGIPIL